jgi:hypothetical protein
MQGDGFRGDEAAERKMTFDIGRGETVDDGSPITGLVYPVS